MRIGEEFLLLYAIKAKFKPISGSLIYFSTVFFELLNMKFSLYAILFSAIGLFVGYVSSLMQADSLAHWYPLLSKSAATPEGWVFAVAWSAIYVLSGISIAIIAASESPRKGFFVRVFAVILALNFLWSVLFFQMQSPTSALIEVAMLDIALVFYTVHAWKAGFKTSAILFLPYPLWCAFATYLNAYVAIVN